jgi:hypothetical protein
VRFGTWNIRSIYRAVRHCDVALHVDSGGASDKGHYHHGSRTNQNVLRAVTLMYPFVTPG